MANEPVNPYAPSTALAHDDADAAEVARQRRRSRFGAIALMLLAHPLAGAGFYVLGRPRRFVAWTAAGVFWTALMVIAVRASLPKVFLVAVVGTIVTLLCALGATVLTKPGEAPAARVWPVAIALIVVAHGGGFAIKHWLAEGFQIPSGTMMPALLVGDHIMVKKGSDVQRGDIVVFKFPQDHRTDYVKRVAAIGGDTIEVRDGVPSINGVPLAQQPIEQPCPPLEEPADCKLVRETNAGRSYTIMITGYPAPDFPRWRVAAGEIFVLGDNRDNSYDSRKWGTLDVGLIKGKPTMTWWSKDPKTGGVRWSRVGRGVD